MTNAKKPEQTVEIPEKATPLGPGEPQVVPSVMGATFAERAKASKAIQGAENKAVKAAESK